MDWPGRNTHITQALFEVTGMCPYLIDITEFNVPPLGQLPPSGLTPANDKCSSRAGGMKCVEHPLTSAIGIVNTDRLTPQNFSHGDGRPRPSMIKPPSDRATHSIKP
jgi:hypothetical protein